MILCRSNLAIILFSIESPANAPTADQQPIHNPKGRLSTAQIMYTVLEQNVEKIIMYIPVAEETFGGTPRLIKIGLKIEPPPNPKAPDTIPPKRAKTIRYVSVWPWNLRSLETNPALYFIFSSCS